MNTPNRTSTSTDASRRARLAHLAVHARGLSVVAVASILGILATFAAQVVSARYLGPDDFGLFSAFLVIVNVAAIGSAALQNLIAVHTAADDVSVRAGTDGPLPPSPRRDRWPREAVILGLAGGALVCALSPWLAGALDTSVGIMIAAAVSIPLSFVLADALGLLQGTGDVSRAVWWSTAAQVARVLLILLVVLTGAGVGGVAGSIIVATALAALGALWSARRIRRPSKGVFTATGMVIVVLTVAFAWLTNSDVLFLRGAATADVAGHYAAVAVLVKTGLLLPSTLSLYLLPRFVRNRDNHRLTRIGVWGTLAISLTTSILMALVFLVMGPWIIGLIYPPAYAPASALLVPMTLAYLPWVAAQGLLVRMTSLASRTAAISIAVAVTVQAVGFSLVLPDVMALLVVQAATGVVLLAAFLIVDGRHARRSAPTT